jgi:hypothetical protein
MNASLVLPYTTKAFLMHYFGAQLPILPGALETFRFLAEDDIDRKPADYGFSQIIESQESP